MEQIKAPIKWKQKTIEAKSIEGFPNALFNFDEFKSDLRKSLKSLKDEENIIISRIKNELVRAEDIIGNNFSQLFDHSAARLSAGLELAELDAKQLSNGLKLISSVAQNISDRVSTLDLGKSRVVECLQRVSDLRDLRTCAEGVEKALKMEEFDEAAKHVHRFLTLDSIIFKMGDQIDAKDAGQSVKSNYETLRKASSDLRNIIEQKFDESLRANDSASMERFFKLFPLINEHASGLKRFGKYLCMKIEAIGNENIKIMEAGGTDDKRTRIIYADTLTLILEGIARVIEVHQPLIETYYGSEKLIDLLEVIQEESDRQTLRVTNAFTQKRQFEMKSRQVEQYVRNASLTPNSIAIPKSASTGSDLDKHKVDALELDMLLYEVTLMHTRAELFWRFLKRRLNKIHAKESAESKLPEVLAEEYFETEEEKKEKFEKIRQQNEARNKRLDTILNKTSLNTKMQELLGKYVLLEQYYMTESVKKAIEMDMVEEGSLTSSLLDDVFFIVRKCIRRSISSSSVDCVCAMINNCVTLLETDFVKYVNTPIKAGYPTSAWASASDAYQAAYNVIASQTSHAHAKVQEMGLEKQKTSFIVAINNLRTTGNCINTLKNGTVEDFEKYFTQASQAERTKLDNSFGQFDEFCKLLDHHINLGINKLCETAIRPKIKSSVEMMMDISHILSEDLLAEFEANDPFMENFVALLDRTISGFEKCLVPDNFQLLLDAIFGETLYRFERTIFKCSFNRLGGLQLDKEYRQLVSYMTNALGWRIREKCSRLSQIVTLLNSESIQEAREYIQQLKSTMSPGEVLSNMDVKKTLALRIDFRDQVKSLKL